MANFSPKIEYTELVTGTPKTVTFGSEPEADPLNEKHIPRKSVSRSTGGVLQTQFNYTIKEYSVEFLFQSEAIKDAMVDFFDNHASKGGQFNYFIHNDEVAFETFEMKTRRLILSRPIPDGSGDFEYDFKFTMERVL